MYPKYCERYKKISINELGDYYERIGFVKEKSYYSIKHLKKKRFAVACNQISTSNHMFKREIWDKFTEFNFLKKPNFPKFHE